MDWPGCQTWHVVRSRVFRGSVKRQGQAGPLRPQAAPGAAGHAAVGCDRRQIEARESLALAELEAGTGGPLSRRELFYAASLCGTLALRGIGPEAHDVAVAALATLSEDQPDVEGLRAMLDTLDGQRRIASRGELLAAMLTARDVVRQLQPVG